MKQERAIVDELAEKIGMSADKIKRVVKIAKEPISLESPISDIEDGSLIDFIEDKNHATPWPQLCWPI